MSKECIFHETRLPERLKMLRGEVSQQKLSAVLGVKQTTFSTWETGRNEPPLPALVAIARHFSVTTDWLLGLTESQSGTAAPAQPRVVAPTPPRDAELSRLWALVESQQRTIEALAKGGGADAVPARSSASSQGRRRA